MYKRDVLKRGGRGGGRVQSKTRAKEEHEEKELASSFHLQVQLASLQVCDQRLQVQKIPM